VAGKYAQQHRHLLLAEMLEAGVGRDARGAFRPDAALLRLLHRLLSCMQRDICRWGPGAAAPGTCQATASVRSAWAMHYACLPACQPACLPACLQHGCPA
jgi:hypothetical protein